MAFNLQEYILFRTEVGRELFNAEVDNNFKMVANPWTVERVYEEGNIVYHPVQIVPETGDTPTGGNEQQLAWWRAKQRTTRGVFDIAQWDLIGGIGNIDAIIDTVTAFGRILVNSTDPAILNSGNNVLLQAQNPNDIFRLIAGTGITLLHDTNTNSIQINAPGSTGEANVGQNIGTGEDVYAGKTGVTLQFRGFSAVNTGSSILSVSTTSNNIQYQVNEGAIDLQNLNNGSPTLNMLSDINAPSPNNLDILQFNSGTGEWNSTSISGINTNIYNTNGTLTTNRIVLLGGNNLSIWDSSSAHTAGGNINIGPHRIPQTAASNTASGAGTGQVCAFLDVSQGYLTAASGSQIRFFRDSATLEDGRIWHNPVNEGDLRIQNNGDIWITSGATNSSSGGGNVILDPFVATSSPGFRLPGVSSGGIGAVLSTGAFFVGTSQSSGEINNRIRTNVYRGLSISYEESGTSPIRTATSTSDSITKPILFYLNSNGPSSTPTSGGGIIFAIGSDPIGGSVANDIKLFIKQNGLLRAYEYGSGTFESLNPAYMLGVDANGRHQEISKQTINGFPIVIGTDTLDTGNSYEFKEADAGKLVTLQDSNPITLEIPDSGISSTITVGTRVEYWTAGSGAVTIVAGSGVTLLSRGNRFTSAGTNAIFSITKVRTNIYVVTGDVIT